MEENNNQLKSIWGKWWTPIRKWFYPAWLIYETSYRFYDYSLSVNESIYNHQDDLTLYIGEIGLQILAVFSSAATFIICTVFLTVPATFILYQFFKKENLTSKRFEAKMKRLL